MQENQTTRRMPGMEHRGQHLATLALGSLGVAELDPQGCFRRVNEPYGRFLGQACEALLGKALREFVVPEDWQDLHNLIDPDDPAHIAEISQQRYRIRRGQEAWAQVFVRALWDDRREVCGYLLLTVDITREQRSAPRLRLAMGHGDGHHILVRGDLPAVRPAPRHTGRLSTRPGLPAPRRPGTGRLGGAGRHCRRWPL